MLRTRPSVNMPIVTETDPVKLLPIVRRKRRVELSFEGMRLWDLIRWDIVKGKMNGPVVGTKITDDPENYNGDIEVNEDGHHVAYVHTFADKNYCPQRERDINPNLTQNDGYYSACAIESPMQGNGHSFNINIALKNKLLKH